MGKTFREKLEETLLEQIGEKGIETTILIHQGRFLSLTGLIDLDKLEFAIVELVKEIVPESKEINPDPDYEEFCNDRWNACRDEMLNRINC